MKTVLIFIGIILILLFVIYLFYKNNKKLKEENVDLKAQVTKYKNMEFVRSEAEKNAKEQKEKINTDNPDDNFDHSLDILSGN